MPGGSLQDACPAAGCGSFGGSYSLCGSVVHMDVTDPVTEFHTACPMTGAADPGPSVRWMDTPDQRTRRRNGRPLPAAGSLHCFSGGRHFITVTYPRARSDRGRRVSMLMDVVIV